MDRLPEDLRLEDLRPEDLRHYEEHAPPPPLRSAVVCCWSSAVLSGPSFVQRVVPDGCVDLIWLGGQLQLAGPDTHTQYTTIAPGTRLTGIRFHPGAAPAALGIPADAIRDARVPLEDAAPALRPVVAKLHEAVTERGEPVDAALRRLTAHLLAGNTPDPADREVAARLAHGTPVPEVADDLGYSDRQLRRRCHAAFGYGPKTLQRILRFQAALRAARNGTPLADVAHTTGYADQAHLSREVRTLADAPLTTLIG